MEDRRVVVGDDAGPGAEVKVAGTEGACLLFLSRDLGVFAAAAAEEEGTGEEGGAGGRAWGGRRLEDDPVDLRGEGLLVTSGRVYFAVGLGLAEDPDVGLPGCVSRWVRPTTCNNGRCHVVDGRARSGP